MKPALLGRKIGMTRVIGERGEAITVTVVKAGPCVVLQVKGAETDGYDAVQLGFEDVAPHRSTMPLIGHAAKVETGPKALAREVRLCEPSDVAAGDVLTVERFADGRVPFVDVVGTSKGAGFAGAMKRHGFGGLEASHGVERKHRSPGSIAGVNRGRGQGPKKGKRMPGQMGGVRCTASDLRLVAVDCDNGLMVIRGSIPGPNGGYVLVQESRKKG
ncbi:MAG: 50S ribosomal protein L3 [Planctomycetes bacterium]|nr:50S ribosomal protein L3 [Planctomycetota bacterium]